MNLECSPNSIQPENLGRPLFLAVDDNEDNLQLLSQLLALNDCSFITALNGETALLMVKKYLPDLIFLDMMLPDVSGLEVVQRLKQDLQTMAIPIIAVTAMARAEDRERFLVAGCNDYIKKPYSIDEVEAIIHRYLS